MKKENRFNPLESKTHRQRRKFIFRISFVAIGFIVVVSGIIAFVAYSSFFKFDQIVFKNSLSESNKKSIQKFLEAKVIEESSLVSFLGLNNFLSWPSSIGEADLKTLPEIAELNIEKDYGANTIFVELKERKPFAIWCLAKFTPVRCFWFDDQGVILKESLAVSGNLIQVISDYFGEDLKVHSLILPADLVPNLISILNVIKSTRLNVKEIYIENLKLAELNLRTKSGPIIYFSLRDNAKNYEAALKVLASSPSFNTYSYVDLRVTNRIYYK